VTVTAAAGRAAGAVSRSQWPTPIASHTCPDRDHDARAGGGDLDVRPLVTFAARPRDDHDIGLARHVGHGTERLEATGLDLDVVQAPAGVQDPDGVRPAVHRAGHHRILAGAEDALAAGQRGRAEEHEGEDRQQAGCGRAHGGRDLREDGWARPDRAPR
jgi:hypothetical protein